MSDVTRILIDNARRKQRLKRGGDRKKVDLTDAEPAIEGPSEDIIAIGEARDKLAAQDPAVAELVKLHYFSGLTLDPTRSSAGLLGYR